MMQVEAAGITDIGKKRPENEDSVLVDKDLGLYVVADGVGGHQAGKVASQIVVDTMSQGMKRHVEGGETEIITCLDPELTQEANRLLMLIHRANKEVCRNANSKAEYQGMGSTVSAVYLTNHTLVAANVGDSPIYLIRKGNTEELSVAHTVQNDDNFLKGQKEKAEIDAYKHVLTRAIGAKEDVEADVCEIQYFSGDRIVICSDGLSDKLSPEEIRKVVTAENPEAACSRLIEMANNRGGDDNITVIVVSFKKEATQKERFVNFIKRLKPKGR